LAANGREGLERLGREHRPHAVLIDLMMPVMSGWQLLEAMARDPALARIPAAVVSAARDRGAIPASVTVLPKPCPLQDLLRFLEVATS
jgi:CheY-like chemotaxis protein